MPIKKVIGIALALMSLAFAQPQSQSATVHITTSDAVDVARMIARNEGYEVAKTGVYSFDLLSASDGRPFQPGYTVVGFDINGSPRNLILISDTTGQAIDYNTCEVFNYPDLRPFQERIIRLSKATKKSARQMADDVGCTSPKVLSKPAYYVSPR